MKHTFIIAFVLTAATVSGQKRPIAYKIDYSLFSDDSQHWYNIYDKGNVINPAKDRPRYRPDDVKQIADNILLFQKNDGGWPKNYDMFAKLTAAQVDSVKRSKNEDNTTFDNGTTYTHIIALSIAYKATGDIRYKDAVVRGLRFILKSQYANGGWPQYYPIEKNNYSSHITYNDGAMIGVMRLIKDILDGKELYSFVDNQLRKQLSVAYNKGIDCILKTQIVDNGVANAWCQQYDEVTLQPAWARKFEPACICNRESAEIVLFLMSIKHPDAKIKAAIESAVKWFRESAIQHTRFVSVAAPKMKTPYKISDSDRIVVTDSTAPQIWTRYYELKTHRPMFSDRNSKILYSLSEVSRERRAGYGWYVYDPQEVLDKYDSWKKSVSN